PIVIINTAEETVINDTNNNQQRERKKPLHDDESATKHMPHSGVPSTKIVITSGAGHHHRTETPMMSEADSAVASGDLEHSLDQEDQMDVRDQISRMEKASDEEDQDQDAVNSDDSLEVDERTETEPSSIACQGVENDSSTAKVDYRIRPEQEDTPVAIEHSEMEAETGERGVAVNETGAVPGDAPSELAIKANQTTTIVNDREEVDADAGSSIDAICGDVDIVVGDTVESDFEELVKAQVEPLDVEDSSEQIQQIHERIIVGIERAVSDEGVVVEDVLPAGGSELQNTEPPVTEADYSDTVSVVDGEEPPVPSDIPVEGDTVKESALVPVTDEPEHADVGRLEKEEEISAEKHSTEQGT
uniref:Uncharacterized protein n=1 Tax=Anopheles maculatus TaxID=74869 RepID=A0A182SED5_9DIPT